MTNLTSKIINELNSKPNSFPCIMKGNTETFYLMISDTEGTVIKESSNRNTFRFLGEQCNNLHQCFLKEVKYPFTIEFNTN